jgi:hypothetical protein
MGGTRSKHRRDDIVYISCRRKHWESKFFGGRMILNRIRIICINSDSGSIYQVSVSFNLGAFRYGT